MTERKRSLPSAGDRNAAPGSREWAIAVRLDILGSLHESDSSAERLERLVALFQQHAGWQQVEGPDGRPFPSYEAFCAARTLDGGLGYQTAVIDRIIRERHDAQGKAQHATRLGDHGTNQHTRGVDSVKSSEKGGNSQDYLIARLARDAPEELERLKRGDYKSAREAALAAGIVKPRVSVEPTVAGLLRVACAHLSAQQRRELVEGLIAAADAGDES